jgi:hypothetical protein
MKRAIILGCSHATGAEMAAESKMEPPPYQNYGLTHSYPVKIAKQLGYIAENYAIAGGSNDAMFRTYEEHHPTLDNFDIVIACWTGCDRTEIWNDINKNWQALAPGKTDISPKEYLNYQQQWITYHTNENIGRLNKIKNIIALNTIANQKNIQVINIDSFWPVHNYSWPNFIQWPIAVDFWEWCTTNNYPKTDRGHFFELAHQEFAEIVVKKLKTEVDKV